MDIFYKSDVTSGTLAVVPIPKGATTAGILAFDSNNSKRSAYSFQEGVLLTNINFVQRANAQFQQSLDTAIYLYAFGDHMGELLVRGLAFTGTCGKGSGGNGIQNMLKYYEEKRVSQDLTQIQISLASKVIRGYLVGLTMETHDTACGIHSFAMTLKTIPAAFRTKA